MIKIIRTRTWQALHRQLEAERVRADAATVTYGQLNNAFKRVVFESKHDKALIGSLERTVANLRKELEVLTNGNDKEQTEAR